MTRKKGVSETLLSIILILIILSFAMIYLIAVNNQINSRITANLRESNVIKLENVFTLTNRSLSMTWYMHTVQAVFQAAETTFGCGYDRDILPENYLYYYDASGRKSTLELNEFLENGGGKYYNRFPKICYLSEENLTKLINSSFNEMKQIANEFSVNGISVKLERISSNIVTEDRNKANYEKDADGTVADVSLRIRVGNAIDEEIRNSVKIFNPLSDIAEAGRNITLAAENLSDWFEYTPARDSNENIVTDDPNYGILLRYVDTGATTLINEDYDTNYQDYLDFVDRKIRRFAPDVPGLAKTVRKNYLDISYVESDQSAVFRRSSNSEDGMVLNYDYSVTYSDGSTFSGACRAPPEDYVQIIKDAVAGKTWTFGDIEYTNEEIEKFISADIQAESSWNPRAVSARCGAAGLNQFMPGTAQQYGLSTFNGASFTTCNPVETQKLLDEIETLDNEEIKSVDERFGPEKSIPAAVRYFHDIMDDLYSQGRTEDPENMMRLAAVVYNAGPGRIPDRSDVKYEEIRINLPDETKEYVDKVMSGFVCYGGALTSGGGSYYQYTQLGSFVKRPFSVTMRIQDHLPAIDCADEPYKDVVTDPQNEWMKNGRIFNWKEDVDGEDPDDRALLCCSGKLYTCDYPDMPGIPEGRKLARDEATNCDHGLRTVENGVQSEMIVKCTACGFFACPVNQPDCQPECPTT